MNNIQTQYLTCYTNYTNSCETNTEVISPVLHVYSIKLLIESEPRTTLQNKSAHRKNFKKPIKIFCKLKPLEQSILPLHAEQTLH